MEVKSLKNGSNVMRQQFSPLFAEINSVLWLAGPGAPIADLAKYLIRYGWALGTDKQSLLKGRVKVDLWDKVPSHQPASSCSERFDAKVIVTREPLTRTPYFLRCIAQLSSTTIPTLVLVSARSEGDAFRTKETGRVHGMYRITYSTKDLIKDIGAYIKGKAVDAITPEEVSKIMEVRDILNDPLSIIASKIPIHPRTATARGSYVVATNDMGDRTALLGQFLQYRITAILPHGPAKSFLIKNKTGEVVYAHGTIYVYGNAEQVRRHGPVFNDATFKAIWKENEDIYSKANYIPNYVPEN